MRTTASSNLADWITRHTFMWRQYINTNFLKKWEEYERLYKGLFSETDRTRASERAKTITPAIQQALEAYESEMLEATFGQGKFFSIEDDPADPNKVDIEKMAQLMEFDLREQNIEQSIADVLRLAGIYGTGAGEIIVDETTRLKPTTAPIEDLPGMKMGGVLEEDRFVVKLKPIPPKNFLVDPNADNLADALGCAVEIYSPIHLVVKAMEDEVYWEVDIAPSPPKAELRVDQDVTEYQQGKVRLTKYYGLVPKKLLDAAIAEYEARDKDSKTQLEKDLEDEMDEDKDHEGLESSMFEDYEDLVEAIVVLVNDATVIKASESNYMMKDRPIVYYRPERIVGRFHGRGIIEKGYNMQKALDAQVRNHLDVLALTSAPMIAMDATRLPRGAKYEVRPGKSLLFNGDPNTAMKEFTLGQPSESLVQTAEMFERMLLQATGTVDSAGMPSQVNGGSQPGAMSLAMSPIIKKNKRLLINFQAEFLVPFLKKAAYRFMQFDPQRYPVKDYKFLPVSTLGVLAREYEQQQYMAMLSTLGPESPVLPLVLKGIIGNSSLSSKEEILAALAEMSKPDPKKKQLQEQAAQLELAGKQAVVQKDQASAKKEEAMAVKAMEEAKVVPIKAQAEYVAALSNNLDNTDNNGQQDFEQRAKIAELALKEEDLAIKERDSQRNLQIAHIQANSKKSK